MENESKEPMGLYYKLRQMYDIINMSVEEGYEIVPNFGEKYEGTRIDDEPIKNEQ